MYSLIYLLYINIFHYYYLGLINILLYIDLLLYIRTYYYYYINELYSAKFIKHKLGKRINLGTDSN